jgi:hypothetical protein
LAVDTWVCWLAGVRMVGLVALWKGADEFMKPRKVPGGGEGWVGWWEEGC